jgi:hypothetical protein
MAATVGVMRFTARSLLVPKIFVNALLIKEVLFALRRSGLTPYFTRWSWSWTGPPHHAKRPPGQEEPGGQGETYHSPQV